MKKSLLLLFFTGLIIKSFSYSTKVADGLTREAGNAANDTIELENLKNLSRSLMDTLSDSALYYAGKMLELAKQKEMFFFVSDAFDLMSNVYEKEGELEKSVNNTDSAGYYAELINDPVGEIFFTNNKAALYIKMGRYFEALQNFEKAKSIGEEIDRPSAIAAALNNMGVVYHYLGDDETSLKYLIKAYEIRRENNITLKLAYSLNNIGALYSEYGNYTEAVEYHRKAKQAALEHNDDYNYLVALLNLGLDYALLNKKDTSLIIYGEALAEAKKQNDQTLVSHALERMSAVYLQLDSLDKERELLQKALEIARTMGNNYDIASFSNSLGINYLKAKDYKNAYPLLMQALTVSKKISAGKIQSDAYKSLTAYFYSTNNSEKAFAYQKLYDSMRDSIFKAETNLKIANLKNRFELNRKMDELEAKEKELHVSRKISGERLRNIYIVGVAGFILLVLAIYILLLYRKIRQKNKIIRQNEKKVKQLLEHEKQLGKLKTQLISTVSHEFRTPMAIISSNVQLLRDYSESMDGQMKKETLNHITGGVNNLISMMQNFELLDKSSILEFNPQKTNIAELLISIAGGLQTLPKFKNRINIVNNLTVKDVVIDKGLVTHIVRNLLINALKFSGNEVVDFGFKNDSDTIFIRVEDRGIGMTDKDLELVFENFHRGSNVENIKGTGVGMSVVKQCVDLHRGEIKIESGVGTGTKIEVALPFAAVDE